MQLIGVAVIGVIVSAFVLALISRRASTDSYDGERLLPCGKSPNCVCSQQKSEQDGIEPLAFDGTTSEAAHFIEAAMDQLGGSRQLKRDGNYMHYECKTPLFGFVDDVEFLIDTDDGCIHVRSASRAGYSDLGANRKRVERIRAMLTKR